MLYLHNRINAWNFRGTDAMQLKDFDCIEGGGWGSVVFKPRPKVATLSFQGLYSGVSSVTGCQ